MINYVTVKGAETTGFIADKISILLNATFTRRRLNEQAAVLMQQFKAFTLGSRKTPRAPCW